MRNLIVGQIRLLGLLCAIFIGMNASAQTHIRYVKQSDLGTKTLYADSVLTSVIFPQGISEVADIPAVQHAAKELSEVLADEELELLKVYVCGSSSPEGLFRDNAKLSRDRTLSAVEYLRKATGVSPEFIHQESLDEDWNRLYELVEESDIARKADVLRIISTRKGEARKSALKKLDRGRVWKVLLEDFFPELRCVRIAFYCQWDETKPYLSNPDEVRPDPVPSCEPLVTRAVVQQSLPIAQPSPLVLEFEEESSLPEYKEPWLMGIKTNLISDAMAIPDLGIELQLGKRLSFDLNGWFTKTNIFCNNEHTKIYGFSPELRWWFGRDKVMKKGHFVGMHGNFAWYTMEWRLKNGSHVLYQNGKESEYTDEDAGSGSPAWSFGVTYGYALALDRRAKWGLEFVIGLGYGKYSQNIGRWGEIPEPAWYFTGSESRSHFGITQVGINLTYRFSLRKVSPDYYKE